MTACGTRWTGNRIAAVVLASLLIMAFAPAARGAIIVGSDLSEAATPSGDAHDCVFMLAPCTSMLENTKLGNLYPAASPARGTVVAFKIKTGGVLAGTFRLLRLDFQIAGKLILYKGDGTGPSFDLSGPGVYEFPANLPIKVGDTIGVDSAQFTDFGACGGVSSYTFAPVVMNGAYSPPFKTVECELLVSAVVVPETTVVFVGAVVPSRGRALLYLNLPSPGAVTVTGQGIKVPTRSVESGGRVALPLRIAAAIRRKALKQGSAQLELSETFTPTEGPASTQSATVKLTRAR